MNSPSRTQPMTESNDLAERCRELLEWGSTGLLAGGSGGAVRALADRLRAKVGDHYALNVAENQTKDEAMREVIVAKARIQELEEALRPFAYTGWMKHEIEHTDRTIIAHMHPEREYEIVLSSEDFKRARDLLQPKDTAK